MAVSFFRTRKRTIIIAVAFFDIAAILFFAYSRIVPIAVNHESLIALLRREMRVCQNEEIKSGCYKRLAGRLAKDFTVHDVLSAVVEGEKYPEIFGDCHELIHYFGQEALRVIGDPAEALAEGTTACFAGYYHGVLEVYLSGNNPAGDRVVFSTIASDAGKICGSLISANAPRRKFNECLHGLGHAFMFFAEAKLPQALEMCDVLVSKNEQTWCYSGVFMENSTSSTNKDHPSKYLKKDDLLYPCSILPERYLHSCYMLQGSYFLELAGGDWKKTVGFCEKVPALYRGNCISMLGQSQVNNITDATALVDNCLALSNYAYQNECIKGTVGALGERFLLDAPERAARVCEVTPEPLKGVCYRQLFSLLPAWIGGSSRESVCHLIKNDVYRNLCAQ